MNSDLLVRNRLLNCVRTPRLYAIVAAFAFLYIVLSVMSGDAVASREPALDLSVNQPAGQTAKQYKSFSAKISVDYGKLPMGFELNEGQTSSDARFIARGKGYSLFLTENGAVLSLRSPEGNSDSQSIRQSAVSMKLKAGNARRIYGEAELPGKVNYLLGPNAQQWRTNVSTFARVRYEEVYPEIDLVYYGNNQRLEYDFELAPGANANTIRLQVEGSRRIRLNARGDLILSLKDGTITLQKPVSYQYVNGKKRRVSSGYVLTGRNEIGFRLGRYNKKLPLVIDPVLIYSTYFGDIFDEQGNGIAVDASGNAYIVGTTTSSAFPIVNGLQPFKGEFSDAFVMKLNPSGSAVLYSTYLGGNNSDFGNGVTVDASENVYVTGQTGSTNFPVVSAVQPTLGGAFDGFVAKINNTGSALVYSTYLGGGGMESGAGIALDASGNVLLTGFTQSRDFPTTNPIQGNRGGSAIFKTTDSSSNWTPSDTGVLASSVSNVTIDPTNPAVLYAASDSGIFKSTNSGATWSQIGQNQTSTPVTKVVVDPTNNSILYAATVGGIYKSFDGGATFFGLNAIGLVTIRTLVIDPTNHLRLYGFLFGGSLIRSDDGGDSWIISNGPGSFSGLSLAVDSSNGAVYGGTTVGIFKSTDGGATWTSVHNGIPFANVNAIALDNSNAVYMATGAGVFKSTNGGTSWTHLNNGAIFGATTQIAVDPVNPSNIYVAFQGLLFKTIDSGTNWTAAGNGYPSSLVNSLVINPANPAILYIGTFSGSDAFVAKLNAAGNARIYATFLGGNASDVGAAIAVGPNGAAFVTGSTTSADFPTANALQPVKGPGGDAFVSQINSNGSLVYSTFLGGDQSDQGRGIGVDANGNAFVAGVTSSSNFPTVNAFQGAIGSPFINDAFVSKLNPAGSALVYSTYLGGGGDDVCFALAVDGAGQAAVTGSTTSSNFPTANAQQPTRTGVGTDVFVTKLSATGSALVSSTYLGGTVSDIGRAIAVDSAGAMYVTGNTISPNFPVRGPISGSLAGSNDVFISKIGPSVEVEVTMTDAPDPVAFGSNLTYTINVKNRGELVATGVTLTDMLPAGAVFVSANSTQGSCSGTGPVTCAIGTLASNQTAVVTLVVQPPAQRSITNTATATVNEVDPVPANNTASAETLVDFAELSLLKKSTTSRVAAGAKVSYLLVVKNNAGTTATPATITDNLPADLTFVSCNVSGASGTCSAQGSVVTASFLSLEVGASASAFLTVQVGSPAVGTVINNTGVAGSSLPDPNTQNNSSTASFTVVANPIVQQSNGKVAFGADRAFTPVSEPSGIYVVNSDGTGEMLFPNVALNSGLPSWSPDGTRLAYTKRDFSGNTVLTEVNVIGADGGGNLKLSNNVSDFNQNISWSPNGEQVAYIAHIQFSQFIRSVFIANTDGSGSFPLPNSPTFLSAVDWSPDATKFVYATDTEIFIMNVDASQQTQITTSQQTPDGMTRDSNPRWSPDGTRILFTRSTNNSRDLYMMNPDGSAQTRLFNWAGDDGDWSPDGQAIVFQRENEIFRVNLDGTNLQRLTDNIYYEFDPSWQPLANPNPTPTPTPAPSFTLSGRITGSNQPGFLFVNISGPVTALVGTDSLGDYRFIRLPPGTYTVTPLVGDFTFTPPSRNVTISNGDVANVDFSATFVPPSITGHVTDINGQPLANIKVTRTGTFPSAEVFTSADGSYAFNNLTRNAFYIVTADSSGQYLFEPASADVQNLIGNQVRNFVGTPKPANRITGVVSEAITDQRLVGVQLNLIQGGVTIATTSTGPGGIFSFGPRPSGPSYTVTVPFTPTYTFTPRVEGPPPIGQIVIPSLTTDQSLTFIGSRRNTVQFAVSNTSVNEGTAQVQISVTRTGDTLRPAEVTYKTIDDPAEIRCDVRNGTAYARCDYSTKVDLLRFAAGETNKTFTVSIVNDGFAEGNETFSIGLMNTLGATLGTQSTATVTINDNETADGANPIFDTRFFVRQHYLDFLSREPDAAGEQSWIDLLNNCSDVNNNPACDRLTVSGAFFGSLEFRLKGYYVFRFFRVAFDRLPTYAEFAPDTSAVTGQTQGEVFQKKAAYAVAFVARPEFVTAYESMTNAQFVSTLLGRYGVTQITTPDPINPDGTSKVTLTNANLVTMLDSNSLSRARVLRAIVDSDEVLTAEFNRAFVAMQYYGYLRRTPEPGGFDAWLNFLNANPTQQRTMINGFMNSIEYRLRFGP